MTNKYLEKVAAFLRSPKNIGNRMAQLGMSAANKVERETGVKISHDGVMLGVKKEFRDAVKQQTKTLNERVAKRVNTSLAPHLSQHTSPESQEIIRKTFKDKVGKNPNVFH
jgi:hypothetical protein